MGSTSNECGVSYQIWRIAKQIRTSDSPSAEGACYIWVQASYLFSAEVFQGTHHLSSLPWQSICLSFVLAPTLPVAMMVAQEEQPFGNDGHVLHVGHHKSRQTFYRCQYECVACLVYPARFFFCFCPFSCFANCLVEWTSGFIFRRDHRALRPLTAAPKTSCHSRSGSWLTWWGIALKCHANPDNVQMVLPPLHQTNFFLSITCIALVFFHGIGLIKTAGLRCAMHLEIYPWAVFIEEKKETSRAS